METYTLTKTAGDIFIDGSKGRLSIVADDVQQAQISGAADLPAPSADGSIRLSGVQGELVLRVPYGASVTVTRHQGDVRVERIHTLRGHDIHGTLRASGIERLVIERDAEQVSLLRRLIEHVDRSIRIADVATAELECVYGSLQIDRAGEVRGGDVGGGAEISAVRGSLELRNIGGGCELADCGGDVQIKNVGGALRAQGIAGRLKVGAIGGSATVSGCGGLQALGNVGGNLDLHEAPLAFDGSLRMAVGGSAHIPHPQDAFTLHAIVGGQIRGATLSGGEKHQIACGNGRSQLSLTVGGNLTLTEG
ncbi:hypothetical protein F8S13_19425 [Chloroflexia bacterium SDU3-3]|nr:hypothetical protein F8S13_19425 [Chloroflexia bacterium SDU3-3]